MQVADNSFKLQVKSGKEENIGLQCFLLSFLQVVCYIYFTRIIVYLLKVSTYLKGQK